MPWPDWSGPSIPSEWEDFEISDDSWLYDTVMTTWALANIYGAMYTLEVYLSISRYAPHHPIWRNPSLKAIWRWAAADTAYPTLSRGIGLLYSTYTPLLAPTVAVASTAGWIATADEHGAVAPGVASGIGMPMTPELYSRGTSSNPAGWDFGGWWDRLF